MATPTREAQMSLLDDRINILDRNAGEADPFKQVFDIVNAILALVRDKFVDDDDALQLSDYCFNVCEALKATSGEGGADDLNESARLALENLGSAIREIERTLRTGTSVPRVDLDKGKIEEQKLKIQQILDALNTPSSLVSRGDAVGERALQLESLSLDSRDSATTSGPGNAFERLIRREFVPDELPSLIEQTFTNKDIDDAIRRLPKDGAQALIDAMDEALDRPDLSLSTRVKCLRRLYRTCGFHKLLPKYLKISVSYDHNEYPLFRGGYADVWKGEHCGQDVAVKVIRTYSRSDLQKIAGRFCKEVLVWKSLQHPNVLPLVGVAMSESHFAMVSDWMANGSICEFLKRNPSANRLELLGDVSRGLIYIHQRGMIHGDLKGANILINHAGRACLADFGLLTIVSDPATLLPQSSYAQGGTMRWMSPELLAPQRFGLKTYHPTKSSDCYALGMVVFETISGNVPFHEVPDMAVFLKVVDGERPCREAGFADSLWEMVEQCWRSDPYDRKSVESVLRCLEMHSKPSTLSSSGTDEGTEETLGPTGNGANKHIAASVCHNCRSTNTPISSYDQGGRPLCRACEPHCKQYDVVQPPSPKADVTDNQYATNRIEIIKNGPTSIGAGSVRGESTVGSPLMGSGNAGIDAGGGASPMNSSIPATSPVSDGTVYRASALYAFTGSADDPDEISFAKGEVLDILDKQGKWWRGRKSDGTLGIVPSNYFQLLPETHISKTDQAPLQETPGSTGTGVGGDSPMNSSIPGTSPVSDGTVYRASALYAFTGSADDPNEISFSKGEVLDILDKQGKWWRGRKSDGTLGIVPSNYFQLLPETHISKTDQAPSQENPGNAETGAGGGTSPMNSSIPGTSPVSDGTVYRASALYAYTGSPDDPNEISFAKGEVLDILDKQGKWWRGRKSDGTLGIVPQNYFQLLC